MYGASDIVKMNYGEKYFDYFCDFVLFFYCENLKSNLIV